MNNLYTADKSNRIPGMQLPGEVTEWLKVRHWKCRVRLVRTAGSNPALSVERQGNKKDL